MRIGVVSDTDGHVANAQAAVRMLESCEVELVIHCGDIGSAEVVRAFDRWPTHFAFGNTDDDLPTLRAATKAGGQACHERKGELQLEKRRIAFLHGDDSRMFGDLLASGRID